jgi:hypothetical protein
LIPYSTFVRPLIHIDACFLFNVQLLCPGSCFYDQLMGIVSLTGERHIDTNTGKMRYF